MLLRSRWTTSAATSLLFFFLIFFHNFNILLKRNYSQPISTLKANLYILRLMLTTVKPQPSSIVFNANPSLSSCLSSLQNFTTFLSFRLTTLHNFSFLTASLSFTLSKIHNFSFLTPNSLSSLLGLFLSSFNWITPSYLFNCHYTENK